MIIMIKNRVDTIHNIDRQIEIKHKKKLTTALKNLFNMENNI